MKRRGARAAKTKSGLLVDPATSTRLANIRQADTAAERLVRRDAWILGLRYRARNRDLPGSPDIASRSGAWAIFVHGCFWHRHTGCARSTTPTRNRTFWLAKFRANRARDKRAVGHLRKMGFRTLTIWECEAEQPSLLRRKLERFVRQIL